MTLKALNPSPALFDRKLILVGGKGGVGKSTLSLGIAQCLAERGQEVLYVTIEDPRFDPGEERNVQNNLHHLNADPSLAFEEYASMKIGLAPLTRIFVRNRLMRYLVRAAPGLHELFILGKIWHERSHYDRVVVDMPSSGYAIALFQCTKNFSKLFSGGPIRADANAMLESFANPQETGNLIVALPEEMPLIEALEMKNKIVELFPLNEPFFWVNKCFPEVSRLGRENEQAFSQHPAQWPSPLAHHALDFLLKRSALEESNLELWRNANVTYKKIPYIPHSDMTKITTIIQVQEQHQESPS